MYADMESCYLVSAYNVINMKTGESLWYKEESKNSDSFVVDMDSKEIHIFTKGHNEIAHDFVNIETGEILKTFANPSSVDYYSDYPNYHHLIGICSDGYLIRDNKWYDPETFLLLGTNFDADGNPSIVIDIKDDHLYCMYPPLENEERYGYSYPYSYPKKGKLVCKKIE